MSRTRKISTVILNEASATIKRLPSAENYKAVDYELNKFTGITTFHGLVRLYSGKWYSKLFWAVVVGTAIVLFVGQVTILLQVLKKKPVVSIVKFQVPLNGIRFPAITVCNYNPIMEYHVKELNTTGEFSEDLLEYIMGSYLQVENLYERYTHYELSKLHNAFMNYTKTHPEFRINKFFMDGGYNCDQMFLQCSFGGSKFNCCDFAKPILTDVGKCFQFNNFSHQEWRNYQYISGSFYGLQMIINVNETEYPKIYRENSFETGVQFFVHEPGVMPFLSSGGFSVSPGFRLYAGIVPQHYQLLPKDQWGTCKPSWEIEEAHVNEYYTAMNCEAHCVAAQFNKTCNCTPLRYNIDDSFNVCRPLDLYHCINVSKWDVEDEEYWYKKCPQCEIECDRWEYDLESSYATFFNDGAMKFFAKYFGLREHQVKLNVVILDIYMKELAHTEYQQVQGTSITETLSDIGGNMGMFIGASIVTIAEISVFLLKVFWSWVSKKRRTDVVRKGSSVATISSTLESQHFGMHEKSSPVGRPIQFWLDDDDDEPRKSVSGKKVHFSGDEEEFPEVFEDPSPDSIVDYWKKSCVTANNGIEKRKIYENPSISDILSAEDVASC